MQDINEFMESLLIDKGITDIEPDIKAELVADMSKRLMDQVNRAAIMQLSEEKVNELNKLMEDPNFNDQQMADFMQNAGVNISEVLLDTMLKFRSYYLSTGE